MAVAPATRASKAGAFAPRILSIRPVVRSAEIRYVKSARGRVDAEAPVVGAGEGIDGAIALRFADGEFDLAVCRRNGDKLAPLLPCCRAVFDGLWRDGLQLPEDTTFDALLANCGLSRAEFDARCTDPQAKQALLLVTEAVASRCLFGMPTFFVRGQVHFGQDRIDWVVRACS